jgi:hypothetical protein
MGWGANESKEAPLFLTKPRRAAAPQQARRATLTGVLLARAGAPAPFRCATGPAATDLGAWRDLATHDPSRLIQ